MKIKLEVEDDEFPEWPMFPEHLTLMWAGIQEEIRNRLLWLVLLAGPMPAIAAIASLKSH